MSCVLADGFSSVSISSVKGSFGGEAMVSRSGVTKFALTSSAAPSSVRRLSFKPSPSSTRSAPVWPCGLGRMLSRDDNARCLPVKPDVEINAFDQIVRCAIVREADRLGDIGTHLGLATGRNLNVVRIIKIPGQGANGRRSTDFASAPTMARRI